MRVEIKPHHLSLFKYIPILSIIMFEVVITTNMIDFFNDEDEIKELLNKYNINNYKINNFELDEDTGYKYAKDILIISFVTQMFYNIVYVYKLIYEENQAFHQNDMNNEAKKFNNNKKIKPINYNNGTVYNNFFWMTMSKISYMLVSPFTLYSMLNINILPNIVYSLIVNSGKELLIITCIEFAFMAVPLLIYNISIIESGRIFYGIIFCNIIIIMLIMIMCTAKNYNVYEITKIQDYALMYNGVYSIIFSIYLYQTSNICYLLTNHNLYEEIPEQTLEQKYIPVADVESQSVTQEIS
tara:strand:+ start:308 stop:1201 length:894 start_codon:yes stop_codon:yes gene_type:complete